MLEWYTDKDAISIANTARLCGHERIAWAFGNTLEEDVAWVAKYCCWLHCFADGECVGYLVLQPYFGMYLMHYGSVPGFRLTAAIIGGFRLAVKIAQSHDRRLAAYINDTKLPIYRVARAMGFQPDTNLEDIYYYGKHSQTAEDRANP